MKKFFKLVALLVFSGATLCSHAQLSTPGGVVNSNATTNNVGVGTVTPKSQLHVDSGAVLFSGTVGALPDSGAGTRLMWIPNRAAFRFGRVLSNEWDASKIGMYSFAGGLASSAESETGFAFGEICRTVGTGHSNIAMGSGCLASGHVSIALGDGATSTGGGGSIAIGGTGCAATGGGSVALGLGSTANNQQSTAIARAWVDGMYGIGIGSTLVRADNAIAIGSGSVEANGEYSVAMGYGANTGSYVGAFVYGDYDHSNGWPIVENSADNQYKIRSVGGFILHTDPDMTDDYSLFFNAGKLGLGTPAPTEKLQVKGKVRIDSIPNDSTLTRFLVADNNGVLKYRSLPAAAPVNNWYIQGTTTPATGINDNMYHLGRVGLGTNNPAERLHVNGRARIDTLPLDSTLTKFVVADNNGLLKYRSIPNLGGDGDWYTEGTANKPPSNTDSMYHIGRVAIGTNGTYGALNVKGVVTTFGGELNGNAYQRFALYTDTTALLFEAPLKLISPINYRKVPYSFSWRGDVTPAMQLNASGNLRLGTLTIEPATEVGKLDVRLSSNTQWNQFLFNGGGQARLLRIKGGSPDAQVSLVQVESNSTSGVEFAEDNIRFVIRGDGRVGVGTGTPIERFTVSGGNTAVAGGNFIDRDLMGGLTTGASIDNMGNIIRTPSDMRLKEDINDLEGNLDKILKLRPVSYQYIDKEKYGTGYTLGFIAQEVEQVLPQVVKRSADAYQLRSLNYVEIIPVLTGAIKEQQRQIDELRRLLEEKNASGDGAPAANAAKIQAALYQNVPNPFNQNTEIKYVLPENVTDGRILVFDMNGKQIKSMPLRPGTGSITIYGSELSAGMYLYSLIANGQEIDTKRMILTN